MTHKRGRAQNFRLFPKGVGEKLCNYPGANIFRLDQFFVRIREVTEFTSWEAGIFIRGACKNFDVSCHAPLAGGVQFLALPLPEAKNFRRPSFQKFEK